MVFLWEHVPNKAVYIPGQIAMNDNFLVWARLFPLNDIALTIPSTFIIAWLVVDRSPLKKKKNVRNETENENRYHNQIGESISTTKNSTIKFRIWFEMSRKILANPPFCVKWFPTNWLWDVPGRGSKSPIKRKIYIISKLEAWKLFYCVVVWTGGGIAERDDIHQQRKIVECPPVTL